MEIYQGIILGVLQGLTEFLPVSSSGHLVLGQIYFNITEYGLVFDASVHMGTLGAVF
ncbi:MAG TPA: undecaprenyl-diphosphate phosphatase, partial [Desulfobacter sp.]|nr:undecaprenyl-diphosphate phosphatase [Desulfobacter sp.]